MSADLTVSGHYGITLWCPHMDEQLLFQKYKAERHAVTFKRYLIIRK